MTRSLWLNQSAPTLDTYYKSYLWLKQASIQHVLQLSLEYLFYNARKLNLHLAIYAFTLPRLFHFQSVQNLTVFTCIVNDTSCCTVVWGPPWIAAQFTLHIPSHSGLKNHEGTTLPGVLSAFVLVNYGHRRVTRIFSMQDISTLTDRFYVYV